MTRLLAGVVRWRVAVRIARRGIQLAVGRSVLIVLLIALPTAGLAGAALVQTSATPTAGEWADSQLGSTGTLLAVVSGPSRDLEQDPVRPLPYGYVGGNTAPGTQQDPGRLLPAETRVLRIGSTQATLRSSSAQLRVDVTTGPSWDPSLAGRYDVTAGRAPRTATEVTLSTGAAAALDVRVGDRLQQTDPVHRTVTVVGIERDRQIDPGEPVLFGAEAAFPSTAEFGRLSGYSYYLPDLALTWPQVQALNRHGIVALSRTVAAEPPVTPGAVANNREPWTADLGGLAVQVGGFLLALLEIGALAAAAFAVGAKTQQRLLAGLAATGADPAMLIRVTTASGLILGLAGGVAGIGLGLAGGSVVMAVLDDGAGHRFLGWHLPVLPLLGVLALAVTAGWAAATIPARAAARQDVVAALRGATHPPAPAPGRTRAGLLVNGAAVLLVVTGLILLLTGPRTAGDLPIAAIAGLVAVLLGVLGIVTGLLLAAGRLLETAVRPLKHARVGLRLAGRDIARNRARTIPAVAVVTLTVLAATFLLTAANSQTHTQQLTYRWNAQPGQLLTNPKQAVQVATSATDRKHGAPDIITDYQPTPAAATAYARILRRELPVDRLAQLQAPDEPAAGTSRAATSTHARDALPRLAALPGTRCPLAAPLPNDDARCGRNSTLRTERRIRIATPGQIEAATGLSLTDAQWQLLGHGGAIATKTNLTHAGQVRLDWYTPAEYRQVDESVPYPDDAFARLKPTRTEQLSAAQVLPARVLNYDLFITPTTARDLRITIHPAELIATLDRPTTTAKLARVNSALAAYSQTGTGDQTYLEHGPGDDHTVFTWIAAALALLIALAASGTAVALAAADARADRATLHATGAPPHTRRTIAAVHGLLTTASGTLLGTALGLIPAAALGLASWTYSLWLPWQPLTLLVIGLPLLITTTAWAGTRTPHQTRSRTTAA